MKILVTNDDGIFAEGLWMLVEALRDIAQVAVVAPDREQSAIGTAVTLRQPLRVRKIKPPVPEVEAYSVEGTPADSVILALGKLIKDKIDMIVSGINQGPNLGDDVFISGTVSAALQGYLRGLPALAISATNTDSLNLKEAAKFAVLMVKGISSNPLAADALLNVNLPGLPLAKVKGVKITTLASKSHTDTVEEGHDGKHAYYWLVRQKVNRGALKTTDIGAIEQGHISITPLHSNLKSKSSSSTIEDLCAKLLDDLRELANTKRRGI